MGLIIDNSKVFSLVESAVAGGQSATMRVVGNSMLPFIRGGEDSVVFSPVDSHRLRKGDIILFRYNGTHVMHRLVWQSGNILMTRGDGVKDRPECFGRQDVVARVTQIIKADGTRVDVDAVRFRVLSRVWMLLRPLRGYLLKLSVRRRA